MKGLPQYFAQLHVRPRLSSKQSMNDLWRRGFAFSSPVSATNPGPQPFPRSPRRWWRKGLVLGLLGGGLYFYDTYFNSKAFTRTARSISVLGLIALDYKLNFTEGNDIGELHIRNADRLFNLLIANKGLYIKIGQALALQASMFPPVFQQKFALLFDNAPQDTQTQIHKTFREEFGVDPNEVFSSFDVNCVASASIAQVHKAQLKSGEWVAVKIQHAELQNQIFWDLQTYKMVMKFYGWFFNLPISEISSFVASRMEKETNFLDEMRNAEISKEFLSKDNSLKNIIYIPNSYPSLSTKRILTCEWIEGITLGKREQLKAEGYDTTWALDSIIRFFSKQIFEWGCVHCDPHPGNIMLRRVNGKPQVVIIDHGLYVYETAEFRAQNSRLWKSLFILDHAAVRDVILGWGIGSVDMFASFTIMRPYDSGDIQIKDKSDFALQQEMLSKFQNMVKDINKMPLVLILLGRANGILLGCNRMYGSPVNRMKIMAYQASKCSSKLNTDNHISSYWLIARFLSWVDHAKFRFAVLVLDTTFALIRIRQFFASASSRDDLGMEAVIERQMIRNANSMGFRIKEGAIFQG